MRITDLHRAVPYLFKCKITPLLIGLHGKGKTSFVTQLAQDLDAELLTIRLGTLNDSGDLIGLPAHILGADGKPTHTVYVAPSFLPVTRDANGNPKKTILFFDEINRTNKDLIQAVFQCVEKGEQLGPHKLVNTSVIAAANPNTDDYNVMDISDKAFTDRFCHIAFEPTTQEFLDHARGNFNSPYIEFLLNNPEHIRKKNDPIVIDYIEQSERSAERVARLEIAGLPDDLFFEVAAGIVGKEAAAAAQVFKASRPKKIDATKILNNYEEVQTQVQEGNIPMISLALDELKQIMADFKEERFAASQIENVTKLCLDLNADVCFNFIVKITHVTSWANDDLVYTNFYEGGTELSAKLINKFEQLRESGVLKELAEKAEQTTEQK
jgi:hypothetical protein